MMFVLMEKAKVDRLLFQQTIYANRYMPTGVEKYGNEHPRKPIQSSILQQSMN